MSIKLKLLKTTPFTTKTGEDHIHYTAAYKGRVLGFSTMVFIDGEIVVDEKTNTVTVSGDLELRQTTSKDLDGTVSNHLDLVPALGILVGI